MGFLFFTFFFSFFYFCIFPSDSSVQQGLSLDLFFDPEFSAGPLSLRIATQNLLCPEHPVGSPRTECPEIKAPGAGGRDGSEEHP